MLDLSPDMILLGIVGIAFIVAGCIMFSKQRKQKSTSQRLEELYKDYDSMMDQFRK